MMDFPVWTNVQYQVIINQKEWANMKYKKYFCGLIVCSLLAGCISMRPATVSPDTIQNPTVGFNGYVFHIPPGFESSDVLMNYRSGTSVEQIASRIFHQGWNERTRVSEWSHEQFSEAFYFKDKEAKSCFILTVQVFGLSYPAPLFSQMLSAERRYIYNFMDRQTYGERDLQNFQSVLVGGRQAVYAASTAYEKNGILYQSGGSDRNPVAYATCFLLGDRRDVYAIIGCADPKDMNLLERNMHLLMEGLSFP
jgi:hypothetical protein